MYSSSNKSRQARSTAPRIDRLLLARPRRKSRWKLFEVEKQNRLEEFNDCLWLCKTLGSCRKWSNGEGSTFRPLSIKTAKTSRNLLRNVSVVPPDSLSMLGNADKNGLKRGSNYKVDFADRFLVFTSDGFEKKTINIGQKPFDSKTVVRRISRHERRWFRIDWTTTRYQCPLFAVANGNLSFAAHTRACSSAG